MAAAADERGGAGEQGKSTPAKDPKSKPLLPFYRRACKNRGPKTCFNSISRGIPLSEQLQQDAAATPCASAARRASAATPCARRVLLRCPPRPAPIPSQPCPPRSAPAPALLRCPPRRAPIPSQPCPPRSAPAPPRPAPTTTEFNRAINQEIRSGAKRRRNRCNQIQKRKLQSNYEPKSFTSAALSVVGVQSKNADWECLKSPDDADDAEAVPWASQGAAEAVACSHDEWKPEPSGSPLRSWEGASWRRGSSPPGGSAVGKGCGLQLGGGALERGCGAMKRERFFFAGGSTDGRGGRAPLEMARVDGAETGNVDEGARVSSMASIRSIQSRQSCSRW